MATLTKPKREAETVTSHLLDSQVPSPFPIDQLIQISSNEDGLESTHPVGSVQTEVILVEPSIQIDSFNTHDDDVTEASIPNLTLQEVMPSIVHVQSSCLMSLSNLLFSTSPSLEHQAAEESSSPLQTLVSKLRSHPDFHGEMMETVIPHGDLADASETEMLRELQLRVDGIASASSQSFLKRDLVLATALVTLLANLNRLSEIHALNASFGRLSSTAPHSPRHTIKHDPLPDIDVFSTLTRQLSDFQLERRSSVAVPSASSSTASIRPLNPVLAVEEGLLWNRIEGDLENVVTMCKERVNETQVHHHNPHHLPPEYEYDYDLDDLETLPDYDYQGRLSLSMDDKDTKSLKDSKPAATSSTTETGLSDEKRRMDLEAVALAIDRLYEVAPQLHNQRVELKKDKVKEMARASMYAPNSSSRAGSSSKASKMFGEAANTSMKGKDKDVKDLEMMMEMIGRASERSLKDQSVVLDGENAMQRRLEKAKLKDDAKRDAFVENLMRHSSAGRIHNQDVVLQHLRVKSTDLDRERDPEALLSLPEFMRESVPPSQRQRLETAHKYPEDPNAEEDAPYRDDQDSLHDAEAQAEYERHLEYEGEDMLTLPEFVKEPIHPYLVERSKKMKRHSTAGGINKHSYGHEEEVGTSLSRTSSSGKESSKSKSPKNKSRSASKEKGKKEKDEKQKKRSRSLSAPPLRLPWLKSSPSISGLAAAAIGSAKHMRNDSGADGRERRGKLKNQGFEVSYVAEHHENLHHVLTFFTINPSTSSNGKNSSGNVTPKGKHAELPDPVEVEILPPLSSLSHSVVGTSAGDHLVIKSGPQVSLPLMLPAHVQPGKYDARQSGGHFEVKLSTPPTHSPESTVSLSSDDGVGRSSHTSSQHSHQSHTSNPEAGSVPLLDATQLLSMKPVSFICSSCSLPLIQSNKVDSYRDLPSEHWEELVEAWMCHADQKLNDHVKNFAGRGPEEVGKPNGAPSERRGFWPEQGQALIGGSYMLFEESAMNRVNLFIGSEVKHHESWRLARCICGALIGRCQQRTAEAGSRSIYRVLKYSVRPVSRGSEALKIPLSAFIVEDMMEFVHAHATYRFVIQDDEDERPRILVWLFKPRIKLAYTALRHHAIPKSANIVAAKVLYKLLSPEEQGSDIKTILHSYPGFPQAEYLSYPMPACRHLAALLNDSNSAYPEGLRQMTGLKVGWLQRA